MMSRGETYGCWAWHWLGTVRADLQIRDRGLAPLVIKHMTATALPHWSGSC